MFYRDNNTKKESHCSLNVRCRCMSFICSVISTCAPVSVAWPRSLQKTLSHERPALKKCSDMRTYPRGCHPCRGTAAELKGSYAVSSHQIIQYVSSCFLFVLHHVSSDHSQIKSSFMIHQICFIHFRVILCS